MKCKDKINIQNQIKKRQKKTIVYSIKNRNFVS